MPAKHRSNFIEKLTPLGIMEDQLIPLIALCSDNRGVFERKKGLASSTVDMQPLWVGVPDQSAPKANMQAR